MSDRSWWGERGSARHERLLIIAIHAVLFLAGSTAALGQQREPDIEMGARLVEARCVFCHNEKSLLELVDRCTNEQGEDYLDEFLEDHHAPDDRARADIIAYLTCPPHLLPSE